MLCSSAVLLTYLFAVVRACHPAENGRWYLSGASLCLKHNDDDRDDSDKETTTKAGSDGDEDDDEDDNDSKADDYDGGDGDDKFFRCRNRECTYRVRIDKAYWRIAGSVAMLCI